MDFTESKRPLNDQGQIAAESRTALLWGREDLLGVAIESLLGTAKGWQVVKILGNHDARALSQEVEKLNPEIVIINQGGCADNFPIPIHLMEKFPKLKIITVNPDNNLVEVYNKQKICINEVSDLLGVIDEYSNPLPKEAKANHKNASI